MNPSHPESDRADAGVATLDDLVDALTLAASGDRRIRGLWLEAETRSELRRPLGNVTLHVVADEPDFPAVVADWESLLGRWVDLEGSRWTDTTRRARQLDVEVVSRSAGGLRRRLRTVLECSAFLAKRPRREVVALIDKTGHLLHVMDFSARSRS